MQPTDEQVAVVDAVRECQTVAVSAMAGTGKTSTLVLVANTFRVPMLALTFSKPSAAQLQAKTPPHVTAGTIHSLAFTAVGYPYGHRLPGKRFDGTPGPKKLTSRDTARALGIDKSLHLEGTSRVFPPPVLAYLATRTVLQFCWSAGDRILVEHVPRPEGIPLALLPQLAETVLPLAEQVWADVTNPSGHLNFDHDYYLKMYQLGQPVLNTTILAIDEAQDLSPVALHILHRQVTLPNPPRLLLIGDESQAIYCQPPGTMVAVPGPAVREKGAVSPLDRTAPCTSCARVGFRLIRGALCGACYRREWIDTGKTKEVADGGLVSYVPIETLKAGDRVVTYDVARQDFKAPGEPVARVGKREYDDDLVIVNDGERESSYTLDHHCMVRIGQSLRGKHLLYLMRRDGDYRMGITAWLPPSRIGVLGFAARASVERADACWVIDTLPSLREARRFERILSWHSGVPTLVFRVPHIGPSQAATAKSNVSQEDLDEFWEYNGGNEEKALAVLKAAGRDVKYPIWMRAETCLDSRQRVGAISGGRSVSAQAATVIAACNVMDGMEMLPLHPRAGRVLRGQWRPVTVRREHYKGPVYSLEVESDHNYVADGLLTHNSWRGAVNSLRSFPVDRVCHLTQSWRFGPQIEPLANDALTLIDDTLPTLRGNPAMYTEVATTPRHGERVDAVLCRTNGQMLAEMIVAQDDGEQVHLTGRDTKRSLTDFAWGCKRLMGGEPSEHPWLAGFATWRSLTDYAMVERPDDPPDPEIALAVRQVVRFGVNQLIDRLKAVVPLSESTVVLSTAHGAKGLEWPVVRLAGGFPADSTKLTSEEINLWYVSVTRAREVLDISGALDTACLVMDLAEKKSPPKPDCVPVVTAVAVE